MTTYLFVATPIATGISLATPKKSPAASVLLAALGAGSGIISLLLKREGKPDAALTADVASTIFGIFSIFKALELI